MRKTMYYVILVFAFVLIFMLCTFITSLYFKPSILVMIIQWGIIISLFSIVKSIVKYKMKM